jgi:hypothetical protein
MFNNNNMMPPIIARAANPRIGLWAIKANILPIKTRVNTATPAIIKYRPVSFMIFSFPV